MIFTGLLLTVKSITTRPERPVDLMGGYCTVRSLWFGIDVPAHILYAVGRLSRGTMACESRSGRGSWS